MTKKASRIFASIMLILAIIFFLYALSHPESSFPWSNTLTFILYTIYIVIMIILFIAPFKKD
jgi:ABC-type transport system involved in cytochrome c biogenesis permease subunit